jgi:hypothetical protein
MVAFPLIRNKIAIKEKIFLNAGVRQGDPLSGLLFILCIEPLLKKADSLNFKTFAYADDLAFASYNKSSIAKTIETINDFSSPSGLSLNLSKCKICRIGKDKSGYLNGIQLVSKFEYLGYQFNQNGIDCCFLDSMLDEILTKLYRIKKFYLNNLQKCLIFNTYIIPKLYYFLFASNPQQKFFKKIQQLQRWFLSNDNEVFSPKKYICSLLLYIDYKETS